MKISASPEQYAVLEVNRPITCDEAFIDGAYRDCVEVLAQRATVATTSLELLEENKPTKQTPCKPILDVQFAIASQDCLDLVLSHRGLPRTESEPSVTQWLAQRLTENGPASGFNAQHAKGGAGEDMLQLGCRRIAERYGQPVTGASVTFDDVTRIASVGSDIVYGLVPVKDHITTVVSENMALFIESSVYNADTVGQLRTVAPVCGPRTHSGIVAPFARIPAVTPDHYRRKLISLWRQRLREPNLECMSVGAVVTQWR
jgi:hypothetical protein